MKTQTPRRDLISIMVLWVVLSAVGEWGSSLIIDRFPGTDSAQGLVTGDAIFFLLRVTVPVMILLALIVVYAAIRFRVADGDGEPSPQQYRSGRAFPWTWLSISVVLNVLFIIHPGITGLDALWSMAANASNPMEIDVTAKQWEWVFDYPDQNLEDVSELVVPVGRPVHFVIRSDDVIHSFWVPAWGIKKAAIPGETRSLVVTPNRIADTETDPMERVQCSQICGVGHADMHAAVRVVSAEDFATWADTTRKAMKESMGGMNMQMNMDGSGQMNMNGSGQMDMNGSGQMDMDGSGQMNMNGSGQMNMNGSGQMNMNGSGQMNMDGGGQMNMDGGGQMNMDDSGQMNMDDQDSDGGNN